MKIGYTQDINWTALDIGEEKVGYKSSWTVDYSRVLIHDVDTLNRPILVNVWYPAKKNNDKSMVYRNYFDIEPNHIIFKNIAEKYKNYNLSILSYELLGKERSDFNEIEEKAFQNFLNKKISVKRNAEFKNGKFPLIIYHQGLGASFEDNAVLAQFLASNGYIVIGSSFFKKNARSLGIDGNEQSIKDIHFLINYASKLENVDVSNIALIGHSAGAQASMLAKANTNNLIKAVVSIETTQETFGLSDTRWDNFTKPILEKLSNINGSILAFTDHKAVFQLYDLMISSDRYYITFPESLNHNEYISQGIFANYINFEILKNNSPNQLNKANVDLSNYIKINNYILDFVQWKLKSIKPFPKTFEECEYVKLTDFKNPFIQLVQTGNNSAPSYTFNLNKLPTPRQVWKMAFSNNTDSLIFTLNHFKKSYSKDPIYHDIFAFALISQLIEDNYLEEAKRLFNFYENEKKPVSERFISLSKFSTMMRKEDYARKSLINLLKVDPANINAKKELDKIKSNNSDKQ